MLYAQGFRESDITVCADATLRLAIGYIFVLIITAFQSVIILSYMFIVIVMVII